MYIGQRVRLARKAAGLTQRELAEKVGIRQSTVSELEQGESQSTKHLPKIARVCRVSVQYLEGIVSVPEDDNESLSDIERSGAIDITRYVPEISMIQAGEWTEIGMQPDVSDAVRWPCPVKCSESTFALRVEGVSMSPDFPPGVIIFVDPEVMPESGKKVVAFLEDENSATFKQYFEDAGKKFLKAMNPGWPEQYTEINGNCRIVGTVIFAGFET